MGTSSSDTLVTDIQVPETPVSNRALPDTLVPDTPMPV